MLAFSFHYKCTTHILEIVMHKVHHVLLKIAEGQLKAKNLHSLLRCSAIDSHTMCRDYCSTPLQDQQLEKICPNNATCHMMNFKFPLCIMQINDLYE